MLELYMRLIDMIWNCFVDPPAVALNVVFRSVNAPDLSFGVAVFSTLCASVDVR